MPSSFGGALRRRRTDARMSLAALAKRTYYSKGYLSKVETGSRGPTEKLARVCDAALGAEGALIELARHVLASAAQTERTTDDAFSADALLDLLRQAWSAPDPWAIDPEIRAEAVRTTFAELRLLGQRIEPTIVLGQLSPLLMALTPDQELLTARCLEFAGWMAQERGDPASALQLTRAARELARRAGDRDLVAHTFVREAEVALYDRDAQTVLEFARLAQQDACVSPRVRVLAACSEAHGHALTGDTRECAAALGRAEALLAQPQEHKDGFTIGTSTVENVVAVVAGWCDLELGRPKAAAEKLQRAVHRLPASARRTRGLFMARACAAYAQMGEPEFACELGRGPLLEVRFTRSASAISQLRVVHRSLLRWHREPVVREFTADLNEVLSTAQGTRSTGKVRPQAGKAKRQG